MKGNLLDGRYQVIEELGEGAFSITYIAEDTRRPHNPRCVVKHLKKLINSDPTSLSLASRLFRSEAETLEMLGKHDQIPQLLASFEENQEFYLVQEFVPGLPLSVELTPNSSWSEGKVVQLMKEVLSILEFVHDYDVIHRDIKPDNLIRRQPDRKLVLIDFGVVKQRFSEAMTPNQQDRTIVVGTQGYLPAEQEQGNPHPNSDLYALGMIAIQALTKVRPADLKPDSTTGEIAWQHLASVSPKLAEVINKMVRYDYRDRYQTATEALEAIKALQPKPARNWKPIAFVGGAIAASLLIGAVIFRKLPDRTPAVSSVTPSSTQSTPGLIPTLLGNLQTYKSLEEALQKGDLEAADDITYRLMLEVAGPTSKEKGRFDEGEWKKFSCEDLIEIDRLWREATQKKQGFSVQKEILAAEKDGLAYQKKVGWKDASGKWIVTPRYDPTKKFVYYEKEPDFKNPPRGHLPDKFAWWDAQDRKREHDSRCRL